MTGGYAELNAPPTNIVTSAAPSSGFKSAELFEQLGDVVSKVGGELVEKIKAVFLWKITKDGTTSSWSEFMHQLVVKLSNIFEKYIYYI